MNHRIIKIRIVILGLLIGLGVLIYLISLLPHQSQAYLRVSFLAVGQGDAIYIVTPDGFELLIDGGPTATVLRELSKQKNFFDRTIDMVLATHYDTDHVGGLVDVLERYTVDWLIESGAESTTPAAQAFALASAAEGARMVKAQAGQIISLGEYVTLKIISPVGDTSNWESNTASAVVQVVYGDTEFMLTGDAPLNIENYLVDIYGDELESEVLKLGHHGSKTSTSEEFLAAVQPVFAVVSAGKDNRYGHPHPEVVSRVSEKNIQLLSTINDGTITFLSDGARVWQE